MAGRSDEPGRHRVPQTDGPPGPREPKPDGSGGRRRPWELLVLGLLVAAVVGSWLWFRSSGNEPGVSTPPVTQTQTTGPETEAEPSEPTPDGDALTVDEYQAEAARVCEAAPNLAPLFSAANPTFSELESVVRLALTSSVDKTLRELGQLSPPPELKPAHDDALQAGSNQAATLDALANELGEAARLEKAGNLGEKRRGDVITSVTEAAAKLDRQTLAANVAYRELGVPACVAPITQAPEGDET